MTDIAPLRGYRVLELGNFIAAPTAGRLLADFGAEVIKIERPQTGDELRNWRLHAGTTSMLFRTINRNKKSMALDLRTDRGRDIVRQLVAHCDVVLENFRPGTLERWGLGPDELERIKPGIVIVRISGYGQTGPKSDLPGFASVAEAVGGLRELIGDPDRPPVRVGVSIGDTLAGLYGAFGAVMALLQRERELVPLSERIIDVALSEAVLSVTESLVADHLAHGVDRTRVGGRIEGVAPSNAYTCADNTSVVIAGNADAIFRRLMHVIDRPDLADDAELATNAGRWARHDELDEAIGAWTANCPRDVVLEVLKTAGVPAGPIYTAADIANDDQYEARNMIQQLPVDVGDGEMRSVGFPGIVPVVGSKSLPIHTLGPELGEHTREILSELLALDPDTLDADQGAPADLQARRRRAEASELVDHVRHG